MKHPSFRATFFFAITLMFLPFFAKANVPLPRGYEQDCISNVPTWVNDAEKWAFEQICSNGRADFDLEFGSMNLPELQRAYDDGDQSRLLRSRFIDHLLHDPKLNSRITRNGVKIFNAVVDELDLQDGTLAFPLAIERSYIASDVVLNRLNSSNFVSFDGSGINGSLRGFDMDIRGNLLMRDVQVLSVTVSDSKLLSGGDFDRLRVVGDFTVRESNVGDSLYFRFGSAKNVNLTSNLIEGNVEITETKVSGMVDLDATRATGSFLARRMPNFTSLYFNGGTVGGQISLAGSNISEVLFQDLAIGESVHIRNGAQFEGFLISATEIGGQLDCDNATFREHFTIQKVSVAAPMYCRFGAELANLSISGSEFSDDVDLTGATISNFGEITRSAIGGSLVLGQDPDGNSTQAPRFVISGNSIYEAALFVGRDGPSRSAGVQSVALDFNTITNLVIGEKAFESAVFDSVRGTTYSNWNLANRDNPVEWFVGPWLGTQDAFEISSYNALSDYWKLGGDRNRQIETLYLREAERTRQACSGWAVVGFSCILRWGTHYTVGYGEKPARALYWLFFFVLTGWLVSRSTSFVSVEPGKEDTIVTLSGSEKIVYSLDDFLPVVRLRGIYGKIEADAVWARRYFHVHKLAGYVMTFYVVAALTGISAD